MDHARQPRHAAVTEAGDQLTMVPSTDGVEVALHRLGGAGPDLVICHATGFHGRAYGPLAASLVDDFTVWAVDFRGHGASTPPDSGDFDWNGMAEDLLACIDAIGATSALAVGHSMGGAAILLAERMRPGCIRGAYLYEPIVLPAALLEARTENPLAASARRRREVFHSKRAALWRYASRPPLDTLRADALLAYVEHGFVALHDGTVRLACRGESEALTFEASRVTIEQLGGLAVPLTVAAGMVASSPNPADYAPDLVEAMPDARLLTYQHLGHFGPFEAPHVVGADARDFLVSCPGADPA